MKIVIDVDEGLVCKGFERPLTEEERNILIRAIGNGTPYKERPQGEWKSLMWVSGEIIGECPFCDGEQVAENYCSYCGARLYGRN